MLAFWIKIRFVSYSAAYTAHFSCILFLPYMYMSLMYVKLRQRVKFTIESLHPWILLIFMTITVRKTYNNFVYLIVDINVIFFSIPYLHKWNYMNLIVQMSEIIWVFENGNKSKIINEQIKSWKKNESQSYNWTYLIGMFNNLYIYQLNLPNRNVSK